MKQQPLFQTAAATSVTLNCHPGTHVNVKSKWVAGTEVSHPVKAERKSEVAKCHFRSTPGQIVNLPSVGPCKMARQSWTLARFSLECFVPPGMKVIK